MMIDQNFEFKPSATTPYGYIPMVATPTNSGLRWKQIIIPDLGNFLSQNKPMIEICGTQEQAQELLHYYLQRPKSGTIGTVKPVPFPTILKWLDQVQVAMPVAQGEKLRRILLQFKVVPLVRLYVRRAWERTQLGNINFLILSIVRSKDQPKVRALAKSLYQ